MYGMSSTSLPKMKINSVSREINSIKFFGINEKNHKLLKGLESEFKSSQRADNIFPIRNYLYIARIEDKFERFKVSMNDEIEKISYGLKLDSGISATVPFYEVEILRLWVTYRQSKLFCVLERHQLTNNR
jgi:hypothetical protein